MTARFQTARWSHTRKRIDAMRAGQIIRLPVSEYFNAYSSTMRSNDAYQGQRKYICRKSKRWVSVERIS